MRIYTEDTVALHWPKQNYIDSWYNWCWFSRSLYAIESKKCRERKPITIQTLLGCSIFGSEKIWDYSKQGMVSTRKKFSCPLAGIIFPLQELFYKNWIPIMLSTGRKKALESVPSQNNVTFYWIPPDFHWQEEGYF